MKPTICITFDSCVHSYTSGWKGENVIPDPPVAGFAEWLASVTPYHQVYVITTRPIRSVVLWLRKNFGDLAEDITVGRELPPANIYIDARGFHFEGRFPTLAEIEAIKPWQMRPKKGKTKPKGFERDAEKAMRDIRDLLNGLHVKDCVLDPGVCRACAAQDILNEQLRKL